MGTELGDPLGWEASLESPALWSPLSLLGMVRISSRSGHLSLRSKCP
jgi:hypothetical protein